MIQSSSRWCAAEGGTSIVIIYDKKLRPHAMLDSPGAEHNKVIKGEDTTPIRGDRLLGRNILVSN